MMVECSALNRTLLTLQEEVIKATHDPEDREIAKCYLGQDTAIAIISSQQLQPH